MCGITAFFVDSVRGHHRETQALVGCGFRIGSPTLFMASRLFGRPELYLPSGPILY